MAEVDIRLVVTDLDDTPLSPKKEIMMRRLRRLRY